MLEFQYCFFVVGFFFFKCRIDSPDRGVGELQSPEGLDLRILNCGVEELGGWEPGELGFGIDVTIIN